MPKYLRPSSFNKTFLGGFMMLLTRLGIAAGGANTLVVKGRKSGQPRSVPVNPLDHEGARYLVAPRGTTEWVRNLRAAGGDGELKLGSQTESFTATEVGDDEKPPIIRAYLEKWAGVTKDHFGVDEKATDEQLKEIAPDHPVFRISS